MSDEKKIYFRNYNNILSDLISHYEETTILHRAGLYVGWNDLVNPDKKIVELCKKHDVPSLIVEHGMKAVSDYQMGLKDIHNGMGEKPFIADNIAVWGDASKDIMLNAGVDESKIHVVGSPIIWDHKYIYGYGEEELEVPFFVGAKNIDPNTGEEWELKGCESSIPKNEKQSIVAYFIHHDYTEMGRKYNGLIYDQLKHRDDLFVKLTSSYLKRDDKNPFQELLEIEDPKDRATKCIAIDPQLKKNMFFIKQLLKKCKAVVTTIPGTINGVCWAMDVPVIVPKIDWGWRDGEGNTIYDSQDADFVCEIDEINDVIDGLCEGDKQKEREEAAKYFMGVDKGNSLKNLMEVVDKCSK